MNHRGRILVVDDNNLNREILVKLLRQDYDVRTAADGPECLQCVAEFQPHLVLLDVMMPGMDGYEVCRKIKSDPQRRFLQVVLITGKGSTAERVQGYEFLADDYLTKPFDHAELRARVRVQFRILHNYFLAATGTSLGVPMEVVNTAPHL